MDKNYNYERKKLMLPEYGRHIHQMIDYLKTIDDRDFRNTQAQAVIAVMGNLNPLLRDTADFTHKLWDHLFIMADFDLDVDSPYPIPSAATLAPKPERINYPDKRIKMKHYGKNVQRMLESLVGEEDMDAIEAVIGNIARYMRTKSYEYNQEHPNNEVIIKDIKRLSDNTIKVDEVALNNLKSEYKQPYSAHPKKNAYQGGRPQKGVKNNKNQQGKGGKQHRGKTK
ncbi:MAG: DUF4290 domain-containing protein [Alistipes sp.]|nr:DUF4290 domain-containing protein [Alistipes sp.]